MCCTLAYENDNVTFSLHNKIQSCNKWYLKLRMVSPQKHAEYYSVVYIFYHFHVSQCLKRKEYILFLNLILKNRMFFAMSGFFPIETQSS